MTSPLPLPRTHLTVPRSAAATECRRHIAVENMVGVDVGLMLGRGPGATSIQAPAPRRFSLGGGGRGMYHAI